MNNFFDNQRILQLIWRKKIHFILVGVIAIILSTIFSGPAFIKPKFKSSARIYPTNLWTMSEESETEQMLEIINSKDISFKMFDVFRLDEVYKVRRDDPLYLTYMFANYYKNVGASKTKFETVEIKVMDYDPQRASDMCDSIVKFYNKKVQQLHKAKSLEMVQIAINGLNKKYLELDSVITDLDHMRKDYGILDYQTQAERVTEGYMKALASGRSSTPEVQTIKKLYDNLAEKGAETRILEARFDYLLSVIDSLTTQHGVYLSEYEKDITYAHIVEHPFPADKKSYPVRWLIVTLSTFSAVFLALLVFLVLDYRKND